jgi:hypothetical protein
MIEIFTAHPWQMTFGERAALEGILSGLQPRLSIEIGTAEGGSLRRIAAHSAEVHSFDLLEPSLPVHEWGDVTLHTGDSHRLLPEFLAQLAADGRNVDFVLVDGDHSADGVEQDLNDLLGSPALQRSVIVVHDTANDIVREGVERVRFGDFERVRHWEPDFVAGHLSRSEPYRLQLWGGLGLVIVDRDFAGRTRGGDAGFYSFPELATRARDVLAGHPAAPAPAPDAALREELAAVRADLENARRGAAALQGSISWRATAPLRRIAGRIGRRRASP